MTLELKSSPTPKKNAFHFISFQFDSEANKQKIMNALKREDALKKDESHNPIVIGTEVKLDSFGLDESLIEKKIEEKQQQKEKEEMGEKIISILI